MTTDAPSSPTQVAAQYFEALRRRDLDATQALSHHDVVDDFVVIGELRGVAMIRNFFTEVFDAFPDFDIEALNIVGDQDHAVVQWLATGTFTGTPFQGIHATGRSIELRGCDVMRFEDGRLKHNTIYYDGLGFARRIGMLPREGSSADRAMTAAFNAGTDVWARLQKTMSKPAARAG